MVLGRGEANRLIARVVHCTHVDLQREQLLNRPHLLVESRNMKRGLSLLIDRAGVSAALQGNGEKVLFSGENRLMQKRIAVLEYSRVDVCAALQGAPDR